MRPCRGRLCPSTRSAHLGPPQPPGTCIMAAFSHSAQHVLPVRWPPVLRTWAACTMAACAQIVGRSYDGRVCSDCGPPVRWPPVLRMCYLYDGRLCSERAACAQNVPPEDSASKMPAADWSTPSPGSASGSALSALPPPAPAAAGEPCSLDASRLALWPPLSCGPALAAACTCAGVCKRVQACAGGRVQACASVCRRRL